MKLDLSFAIRFVPFVISNAIARAQKRPEEYATLAFLSLPMLNKPVLSN